MPFLGYFKIWIVIQLLYFSETCAFATLLTFRSSGWNLLVKVCGMIISSQLFLAQSSVKSFLSCPLTISIIISNICSFAYPIFSLIWYRSGKIIFSKCSVAFNWFDHWFSVYVTWKLRRNSTFGKHLMFFQCSLVAWRILECLAY